MADDTGEKGYSLKADDDVTPDQELQRWKIVNIHMDKRENDITHPTGKSLYQLKQEDLEVKEGKVCLPVLDHLETLIMTQSRDRAGGSYKEFLQDSVSFCKKNREVNTVEDVEINTITFSKTPVAEVKKFIESFNKSIGKQAAPGFGSMPSDLYSFDVQYVTAPAGKEAKVAVSLKDKYAITRIPSPKVPARISLITQDTKKRWDIVFPWVLDTDLLINVDGYTPDLWHKLFSKLRGIAIGENIEGHIESINMLMNAFKFLNCKGNVQLQIADIDSMFNLCGWESGPANIMEFHSYFTGSPAKWLPTPDFRSTGWSSPELIAEHSLFIHRRGVAVIVMAMISMIGMCIIWFPTPGIAALVSNKEPEKFLIWFLRFFKQLITDSQTFNNQEISKMKPKWRNVTGGGCLTDLQAVSHISRNIYPVISKENVPYILKWDRKSEVLESLGPLHDDAHEVQLSTLYPGVCNDPALIEVPKVENFKKVNKFLGCVCSEIKEIISNNHPNHPLCSLSEEQLAILFTWSYPRQVLLLWKRSYLPESKESTKNYFSNTDLLTLKPILSAFCGITLEDPAEFSAFKAQSLADKQVSRFECLIEKFSDSTGQDRKKIKAQSRTISRNLNTSIAGMHKRVAENVLERTKKLKNELANLDNA